jgi:multiple sugar transport system permease protein
MLSTRQRRNTTRMVVVYSLLFLFVVFAACPLAWMLSTAVKPRAQIFQVPPRWIPEEPTLEHFRRVILPETENGKLFGRYFVNSTIVSVATSVLSVIVAAPAAYAFSRFNFPGKNAAYFGVLVRNMFPLVVFLIPLFFMMRTLRLQDTHLGLIIAYLTFSLPLSIWLMKGFFDGIPPELERAAMCDGCTRFGAFMRIILPLTLPGLAATAIYSFILAWNEFPYALQLTHSTSMRTLPVGLAFFFTENTADWPGLMATAFTISIPVVIVFLILQRYFVSALTQGAVKQ